MLDLALVSIPSNLIRTGGGRGMRVFSLKQTKSMLRMTVVSYLSSTDPQLIKNTRSLTSDYLILYKKLK